jgi:hypothetical protein
MIRVDNCHYVELRRVPWAHPTRGTLRSLETQSNLRLTKKIPPKSTSQKSHFVEAVEKIFFGHIA